MVITTRRRAGGIFTERHAAARSRSRTRSAHADQAGHDRRAAGASHQCQRRRCCAADGAPLYSARGRAEWRKVLRRRVRERDLFALQRLSLRRISADIAAAMSIADVQGAAARIRLLARNLLAQDRCSVAHAVHRRSEPPRDLPRDRARRWQAMRWMTWRSAGSRSAAKDVSSRPSAPTRTTALFSTFPPDSPQPPCASACCRSRMK